MKIAAANSSLLVILYIHYSSISELREREQCHRNLNNSPSISHPATSTRRTILPEATVSRTAERGHISAKHLIIMDSDIESPIKRRVSNARLRSPLPAVDLTQGISAISRLERSAEELSAGGSDIAEEIKKLVDRSRQNSIQSSHQGEFLPPRRINSQSQSGPRSRASSYANSVVDARSGGYTTTNNYNTNLTSPLSIGSVTSPIGSVRSGSSWTHASIHRAASGSKSSRLGQMVEPL